MSGQIAQNGAISVERASSRTIGLWLVSAVLVLSWAGPTRAQSFSPSGMGPGTMPSYRFSGVGSYFSGTSAYVPFSTMGGFVPYSPGPGGGLGVQPGMRSSGAQMQTGGMGLMGPRPRLGLIRGQITPIAPITSTGMGGMGPRAGMGSMGGLIRRTPAGGSMGGMARPPVGGYPFRQPPSLLGPATATPSMSM
jgi:hypothetical protein